MNSPSPFVVSDEGEVAQKKIWNETFALLRKEAPNAKMASFLFDYREGRLTPCRARVEYNPPIRIQDFGVGGLLYKQDIAIQIPKSGRESLQCLPSNNPFPEEKLPLFFTTLTSHSLVNVIFLLPVSSFTHSGSHSTL